jgi:hypothetical protein
LDISKDYLFGCSGQVSVWHVCLGTLSYSLVALLAS